MQDQASVDHRCHVAVLAEWRGQQRCHCGRELLQQAYLVYDRTQLA